MATKKANQRVAGQGDLRGGGGFSNGVRRASDVADSSGSEDKMGFLMGLLAMVVVFAMLLPLIGMIYMDTMTAKEQTRQQYEKVEKLRKKVEDERRQAESERHPEQGTGLR